MFFKSYLVCFLAKGVWGWFSQGTLRQTDSPETADEKISSWERSGSGASLQQWAGPAQNRQEEAPRRAAGWIRLSQTLRTSWPAGIPLNADTHLFITLKKRKQAFLYLFNGYIYLKFLLYSFIFLKGLCLCNGCMETAPFFSLNMKQSEQIQWLKTWSSNNPCQTVNIVIFMSLSVLLIC